MTKNHNISTMEFIAMMASLMAINALAVDMILPAFSQLRISFDLPENSNIIAKSITYYMMGLGLGQIIFGPLSDSYGRKNVLFAGLSLYIIAALFASISQNLSFFIAARFMQGIGSSSARVLAIAITRDKFEGRMMAKVLSWIMMLFILFPIIAPQLGQGILLVLPWQFMFYLFCIMAIITAIWVYIRLPETLPPQNRRPLSITNIVYSASRVLKDRYACGYMLVATFLFGGFSVFLSASETIFGRLYNIHGIKFTLTFSFIALFLGIGNMVNARIVERFGMRVISQTAYIAYLSFMGLLLLATIITKGQLSFLIFIPLLICALFFQPMIFANTNTMAMENMKPIAGVAAAVIGSISTFVGAYLGQITNNFFEQYQNLLPVSLGFFIYGLTGFIILLWVERFKLFQPKEDSSL